MSSVHKYHHIYNNYHNSHPSNNSYDGDFFEENEMNQVMFEGWLYLNNNDDNNNNIWTKQWIVVYTNGKSLDFYTKIILSSFKYSNVHIFLFSFYICFILSVLCMKKGINNCK